MFFIASIFWVTSFFYVIIDLLGTTVRQILGTVFPDDRMAMKNMSHGTEAVIGNGAPVQSVGLG